ncbi:adhesive plaque matrix protein-like [Antechinus flavipes]|uniref:adhesive plaque matrix protein-like n=1 Tax=Antechinus flavipes TaxID=38775 RepID=UPI002235CDC0|nr:adhesive plaque matrix protein-like [Antechinus flavipes]
MKPAQYVPKKESLLLGRGHPKYSRHCPLSPRHPPEFSQNPLLIGPREKVLHHKKPAQYLPKKESVLLGRGSPKYPRYYPLSPRYPPEFSRNPPYIGLREKVLHHKKPVQYVPKKESVLLGRRSPKYPRLSSVSPGHPPEFSLNPPLIYRREKLLQTKKPSQPVSSNESVLLGIRPTKYPWHCPLSPRHPPEFSRNPPSIGLREKVLHPKKPAQYMPKKESVCAPWKRTTKVSPALPTESKISPRILSEPSLYWAQEEGPPPQEASPVCAKEGVSAPWERITKVSPVLPTQSKTSPEFSRNPPSIGLREKVLNPKKISQYVPKKESVLLGRRSPKYRRLSSVSPGHPPEFSLNPPLIYRMEKLLQTKKPSQSVSSNESVLLGIRPTKYPWHCPLSPRHPPEFSLNPLIYRREKLLQTKKPSQSVSSNESVLLGIRPTKYPWSCPLCPRRPPEFLLNPPSIGPREKVLQLKKLPQAVLPKPVVPGRGQGNSSQPLPPSQNLLQQQSTSPPPKRPRKKVEDNKVHFGPFLNISPPAESRRVRALLISPTKGTNLGRIQHKYQTLGLSQGVLYTTQWVVKEVTRLWMSTQKWQHLQTKSTVTRSQPT